MSNNTETSNFFINKKPSAEQIWVIRKVSAEWWVQQKRKLGDTTILHMPFSDFMLEVAEFAPVSIAEDLLRNSNATVEVLEAVLRNKTFINESTLTNACIKFIENRKTPEHILDKIVDSGLVSDFGGLLLRLASHENMSPEILGKLIRKEAKKLLTSFTLFYHIAMNDFAPSEQIIHCFDVLKNNSSDYSTMLKDDEEGLQQIWDKNFTKFVAEHKQLTGVDVSDWPEEWVFELVK